MNDAKRGSVLMELIVVFPIYLILFGGMFMVGALLIRTLQLPSAERVVAHDVQSESGGWDWIKGKDNPRETILQGEGDNPVPDKYSYYADENFSGPWAFCAGSKVLDKYKTEGMRLPRGQLRFADRFIGNSTQHQGENIGTHPWREGVLEIASKAKSSIRAYNYYTYKRVRYSSGDIEKIYRAMPGSAADSGRLVDARADFASWKKYVVDETRPEIGNDESNGVNGSPKNGPPENLKPREYIRYAQFVTWSD